MAAPLEGPVPWLLAPPSLLSSVVDWSVRKLARERRRKLLKNVGAMLEKRVGEVRARDVDRYGRSQTIIGRRKTVGQGREMMSMRPCGSEVVRRHAARTNEGIGTSRSVPMGLHVYKRVPRGTSCSAGGEKVQVVVLTGGGRRDLKCGGLGKRKAEQGKERRNFQVNG